MPLSAVAALPGAPLSDHTAEPEAASSILCAGWKNVDYKYTRIIIITYSPKCTLLCNPAWERDYSINFCTISYIFCIIQYYDYHHDQDNCDRIWENQPLCMIMHA